MRISFQAIVGEGSPRQEAAEKYWVEDENNASPCSCHALSFSQNPWQQHRGGRVVGILRTTLVRHLSPPSDCAKRLRVAVFSIRDKDLVIRLLE